MWVKVSPGELLLLGSLCYLGRGWTFDDCEESTAIEQDVYRVFLCVFLVFGSTVLYKRWVLTPVNFPKAQLNMKEYSMDGFPGCIGSCNCTHIVADWCEYNLKNNYLGAKSSLTTWTFNLTCNHRCQILHTTIGGPGRWNNQSMVRIDSLVSGICDGSILEDVNFELLANDKAGRIKKLQFSGVYLLWITGTWTGRAPCLLLEFLTTLSRYGGSNSLNEFGKMWSALLGF